MRNFFILLTLFIFIISRGSIYLGASYALNLWCKSIFPILFPTFILSDLLLSSSLINHLSNHLGKLFGHIFKTSKYALFIFILSLLSGTPTNVKILKKLYEEKVININSITKILSFSYFFNPFFILSFVSFKVLIIFWLSNILTGIILRNYYIEKDNKNYNNIKIPFELTKSIANNMILVINILGTITIFMVISYSIPFINEFVNVIITSILEVSSGLYKIKLYFNSSLLSLIALSFGGISILMQIKSILKDTFIDIKFIILSRFITCLISITLFFFTHTT